MARFPGLPEKPLLRVTRFYDESRKLVRTELNSEQCRQLYLAFEVGTVLGHALLCSVMDLMNGSSMGHALLCRVIDLINGSRTAAQNK